MKNGHGGKRKGAGKPKGVRWPSVVTKEKGREALRQLVLAQLQPMAEAQIANAKGIKYLVVREKKTGKFLRVGELRAGNLKPDEELVEVWEKDPSVQAFTDLLNRALDKPKEQEQEIKLTAESDLIGKLLEGRKRAAAARNGDA